MDNVLLWGLEGPTTLKYFSHMNQDVQQLQDRLLNGITNQLDANEILDYKLIFVEFPNHDILSNLHTFSEKNIIIFQSDHLQHHNVVKTNQSIPISDTVLTLVSAAEYYKDKNIVFYTLTATLDRELSQITLPENLIIKWGQSGTLLFNVLLYKNCRLVLDKNLNSNKLYANLNNRHRMHRPMVVSYLLGKQLENLGIISLRSPAVTDSFNCFNSWSENEIHQQILKTAELGADKINHFSFLDVPQIGNVAKNCNVVLSSLYEKVFVEIISDTTFFEPTAFLNEKYFNSVVGANFPIFVSSAGTVQQLRALGFDMFDDIVDHSYDTIVDPILRLSKAIDLNQHLLTDIELTKKLWVENTERFVKNYNFLNSDFITIANRILNQTWASGAAELKLKCSNTV